MDCSDPSAFNYKDDLYVTSKRVNIKSMNKDEHLKVCFDIFFILYMLYFRSRNNKPTLQITNLKLLIRNQISCK